MNITPYKNFKIRQNRLTEVCKTLYEARLDSKGFFAKQVNSFLPQYNLPQEIEEGLKRNNEKSKLEASFYLWTEVFFERLNKTLFIMKNTEIAWNNPQDRWIFYPEEIIKRPPIKSTSLERTLFERIESEIISGEIYNILKNIFRYNLRGRNEPTSAERFFYNANKLVREYNGDPRKIINNISVEEARKRLQEFQGIGTGIANLFIIYLHDRKLAFSKDIDSMFLKVDVHKGRIPINTEAITPKKIKGEIVEITRGDFYIKELESAYRKVCQETEISASYLDSTLWIIGSELCSKRDARACEHCPLYKGLCVANTPDIKSKGRYIFSINGKRPDNRNHGRNQSEKLF